MYNTLCHLAETCRSESTIDLTNDDINYVNLGKDTQIDILGDSRPTHIYFAKKCPEVADVADVNALCNNLPKHILYATNWSEMADLFKYRPESICVNAVFLEDTTLFEIINMIDTFARLVGIEKEVSITLGVNRSTPYRLVKDAQKSRIAGIIPSGSEFGIDECLKGIQAQWNNIPYWPKHIMEALPGAKPLAVRTSGNEVVLTARQQQIFDIVTTRGCSNKQVAKLLNISESTVKLHMSAVFKKYGVKSRTQLAVFCKQQ